MDNKGKKELKVCPCTCDVCVYRGPHELCVHAAPSQSSERAQPDLHSDLHAPSPSLQELIGKTLGAFDAQTDDEKLPNTIKEGNRWLKEHKNEHLFSHECYGEPMYDLDRDKIRDFLQSAITESYEQGYAIRGGVESEQKQRMYDAGLSVGREEGRRAATSAIVEKIKELRAENKRTEKWSDDYYHALDDLISWLSQDH